MHNEVLYTNFRLLKNNNGITRESLEKDIEKAQLSLRKEKIDNLLASKRKFPQIGETQDNSYRIQLNDLQLPSEYEINLNKYYENFNLPFLKNYFYSNDILLQKYALSILLKYISAEGALGNTRILSLSSQYDSDFLSLLCHYLLVQDKSVQYEACWVIMNIVMDDQADSLISDCEENMRNISIYLLNAVNDNVLLLIGLCLVRNLTADNVKTQSYFLREKLLELFPVIIDKYPFEEKIKELMILIVNNLLTAKIFLNQYAIQFFLVIPLLTHKLSPSTPVQLLRRVLFSLDKLSNISESIDLYIENGVHIKIMQTLPELKKTPQIDLQNEDNAKEVNLIIIYSLKIIGNLMSNNDVQTQRLINDNIVPFLNFYLEDSSLPIVQNALLAIGNIAGGTLSQIIELYKKNSLLKTIHCGIELYKELCLTDNVDRKRLLSVFKEVLYVICFCITGSLNDSLLLWLGYSNCIAIVFLCQGLKLYQSDYSLITNILQALTKVIRIEKDNDPEMKDEHYINTLISNDIEENIKRLQSCCNSEICNLADTFYDDLFN